MIAKRYSENEAMIPPKDKIVELSFMISHAQFDALERAARTAQMTVAQYLRRLVQYNLAPANTNASSARMRI